ASTEEQVCCRPMSPPIRQWTILTRICIAILVVRFGVYPLAAVARAWRPAAPAIDQVLLVLQPTLLGVGAVAGLVWFHRAWGRAAGAVWFRRAGGRVPPVSRHGYDGQRIDPSEALWKLFIPIYGIYWLFQANIGLCGAVEHQLRQSGAKSTKAPSTLAFIACL